MRDLDVVLDLDGMGCLTHRECSWVRTSVELGATVAEPVDLELSGHEHRGLRAPRSRSTSTVATAASQLRVERRGEPGARRVDDPARREMGDAIDHAGAIGDRDEHPVLDRARRHDVVGEPRDLGRPVHRHGDDVGTSERERTTHLGEAEVVTDRHAEPAEGEVEHGAQPVARHDESVGAEDRQVGLAHVVHRTVGAEDRRGVVQRIAGALEESDDHGDAASDCGPCELVETAHRHDRSQPRRRRRVVAYR